MERRLKELLPSSKELYKWLPTLWNCLDRVLADSSYAKEFDRQLRDCWRDVLRMAVYRGIGTGGQIVGTKKRQLTPDVTKWDVTLPNQAKYPVISAEIDSKTGLIKYILGQQVGEGEYDQIDFYVSPENKIKGLTKIVARHGSRVVSANGRRADVVIYTRQVEIDFSLSKLDIVTPHGVVLRRTERLLE